MAKKEKTPRESNPIISILVGLLVVVGIGETGLLSYIGLTVYGNIKAQQAYEAQQAAIEAQQKNNPVSSRPSNMDAVGNQEADGKTPQADEADHNPPDQSSETNTAAQAQDRPQEVQTTSAAQSRPSSSGAETPSKTPEPSGGTTTKPSADNQSSSTAVVSPNQPQAITPSTSKNPSDGTQSSGNGEETYTHDFSGGRVLVTTASNNNNDPVYHTQDCRAAIKISPSDAYWYDSAKDAEAAGRRLCGNCKK